MSYTHMNYQLTTDNLSIRCTHENYLFSNSDPDNIQGKLNASSMKILKVTNRNSKKWNLYILGSTCIFYTSINSHINSRPHTTKRGLQGVNVSKQGYSVSPTLHHEGPFNLPVFQTCIQPSVIKSNISILSVLG